jgi:hypothetical protein
MISSDWPELMPGRVVPLTSGGRKQIVARHPFWAGDLLERHQAAERHHLSFAAAHADLRHALRVQPVVAVGLGGHPVGAAEHVEVVDIGRAHEHAHGLEDVGDGHLQHLRLVAVDVDVDLRRRGLEGREHVDDAGRAVGLGDELLRDEGEFRRRHAERVLQAHREAGRCAHAAHRRRDEYEGLRLLDLRQLAAHLLGNPVDGLALLVTLLEIVEHEEQQAGVGGGGEGGAVAARESVGILDAGRGQHQVRRPLHDRIGARQRRPRWKLQRDDQDGAVEGGNKAGRQALHEPAGKGHQQDVCTASTTTHARASCATKADVAVRQRSNAASNRRKKACTDASGGEDSA